MPRTGLGAALALVLALAACSGSTEPPAAAEHASPSVTPGSYEDWCGEHGVPESACTRCNADLIASFKAKGDWCEKHSLPKSQCVDCDPSLAAKLAAMAPK